MAESRGATGDARRYPDMWPRFYRTFVLSPVHDTAVVDLIGFDTQARVQKAFVQALHDVCGLDQDLAEIVRDAYRGVHTIENVSIFSNVLDAAIDEQDRRNGGRS